MERMSTNPVKPTTPETRHPFDEITSGSFIYDALRVAVWIVLLIVITYLSCDLFGLGVFK